MSPKPSLEPDTVLIPRLLAGDNTAFESLVREYHKPLKRVAAAIVGEGQAEGVVQEAWISVLRSLSTFEARSSLKTWLYTIVANEAKGRLRKGKREVALENHEDVIPCDDSRFVANGHWRQPPAASIGRACGCMPWLSDTRKPANADLQRIGTTTRERAH